MVDTLTIHAHVVRTSVYHVTKNVTKAEVRAMLTIAGNENVVRQELISRGVLVGY